MKVCSLYTSSMFFFAFTMLGWVRVSSCTFPDPSFKDVNIQGYIAAADQAGVHPAMAY